MPFQIAVPEAALAFPCRDDQTVLGAMIQAGASALQVGCRSGGCGVCRVQVLEGRYETGTMSHAQVSQADRNQGIVLSCQLFPRSDLRLRALGRPLDEAGSGATVRLLRRVTSPTPSAHAA